MHNHIIHKTLGFLVLIAFTVNTSFSQKNYRPGYLIKNSGDTLFGLIDYKNSDKNPDKLFFKLSSAESPATYKPSDLMEFGLNKEVYIKGILKSESLEGKNDTVFLQTLFSGRKSLYFYKNGIERFFIKRNGKIEQLITSNYIVKPDETSKTGENKKYIEQLSSYLSDCSKKLNLKQTSYSKNSLINLFDYYYKYNPSYNYYQTRKVTTEFGAFIGASLTNIDFNGEGPMNEEGEYSNDWIQNVSFGNSIRPSVGLYLNFIFPWSQKRFSFNNELMFSNYNLKAKYKYIVNPTTYYNTAIELGYSYLKINNLVRYTQPIGTVSIFVNGGISTGWAIFEKQKVAFDGNLNSKGYDLLQNTRIKEHGFIIGSGIKLRKYSFELRYEIGDGMEAYYHFSSTTKRYFILLGYTF